MQFSHDSFGLWSFCFPLRRIVDLLCYEVLTFLLRMSSFYSWSSKVYSLWAWSLGTKIRNSANLVPRILNSQRLDPGPEQIWLSLPLVKLLWRVKQSIAPKKTLFFEDGVFRKRSSHLRTLGVLDVLEYPSMISYRFAHAQMRLSGRN